MSEVLLFLIGVFVTSVVGAAVAMLVTVAAQEP